MADAGAEAGVIEEAVKMIGWVSCSANGNSCPEEANQEPEWLWPRWADRLEAVGSVGIVRCYQYNSEKGDPLSSPATPRPATEDEVFALAMPERFAKYQASSGGSVSMMDHYYDKLLQVARPPPELVRNSYLEMVAADRVGPLVSICLAYGQTGEVPISLIQELEAAVAAEGAVKNAKGKRQSESDELGAGEAEEVTARVASKRVRAEISAQAS
uniref:Uncharacterized protein n=1 Tax=Haptolina ericina TaxID=156174 RepID=A0A7S3AVF9_9EUKA